MLLAACLSFAAPRPARGDDGSWTVNGPLIVNLGAWATYKDAEERAEKIAGRVGDYKLAIESAGEFAGHRNFHDQQPSVTFTVGPTDVNVAAFSDDGVTVKVRQLGGDRSYYTPLMNKGEGQALPNIGSSLRPFKSTLRANERYTIVVDYINTLYTGDGDLDGILLMAYGGKVTTSSGPCQVTGIDPDEATVCVGQEVTFTAKGEHLDDVEWSGGGEPATGTGASFTTKWGATDGQTVQASCGGASATAEVMVTSVAFSTDTVRTGYTLGNDPLTIAVEVRATCDPEEIAETVRFVVRDQKRVEIEIPDGGRDSAAGTVTFFVTGTSGTHPNHPDGDTRIVALLDEHECAEMSAVVIVPTRIMLDNNGEYPQADGAVNPVNLALDAGDSPAMLNVPAGAVALVTAWLQWMTIPVEDQFGNRLDALYEGAEVHEFSQGAWHNINQPLSAAGTYQDPVGYFVEASPLYAPGTDNRATSWPGPGTLSMPAQPPVINQRIPVEVGGHKIGTIVRKVTPSPLNTITVEWPAP